MTTDNKEFLEQIIKLAKQYTKATGIACRVIDAKGNELYRDVDSPTGCQFCSMMRKVTQSPIDCVSTHVEGSYQAQQLDGSYVYSCPSNFVFWSSPILYNGQILASIIAGSSIINSKDDYLKRRDIRNRFKNEATPEALQALKKVINLDEERIASLSELLILACRAISDNIDKNNDYEIVYRKPLMMDNDETAPFSQEREQILLEHVANGDEKAALETLNDVLKDILDSNFTFHQMKSKALRLAVLLAKTALENGASSDEILTINLNCLKEIHQKTDANELASWLNHLVMAFCDSVFKLNHLKHGESIAKALRYIQKKFAYNISLEDVADQAALSPSYFSRVFKQEMKMSFTEYLNKIRIEESKRLLRNDVMDLSSIAEHSGFADQSYFTKIFKKTVGLSPGKFRSNFKLAIKNQI